MKVVYVGSFDPPHFGHRNTYEKALRQFNRPIEIAICKSPLKKEYLFSLEERKTIAESVFLNACINLYNGQEQIIDLINNVDMLVRGYCGEQDIIYVKKLLKLYNCENKLASVFFIKIDDKFEMISSSSIKASIQYNSQFAKENLSDIGYEMLLKKYKKMGNR